MNNEISQAQMEAEEMDYQIKGLINRKKAKSRTEAVAIINKAEEFLNSMREKSGNSQLDAHELFKFSYNIPEAMPVHDSIVRKDQEQAIFEDLQSGQPVTVRGFTRMGKTSMIKTLAVEDIGKENCMMRDISVDAYGYDDENVEAFKSKFLLSEVGEYIAKNSGVGEDDYEKIREITENIKKQGLFPPEALSRFSQEKNITTTLFLDEVIGFAKNPKLLKMIADLHKLPNLNVGMVVHRSAKFDPILNEAFADYKEYYVRPLTTDEVAQMIKKYTKDTPFSFEPQAIEAINLVAGGRPMEINILVKSFFQPGREVDPSLMKEQFSAQDFLEFYNRTWARQNENYTNIINNYKGIYKNVISQDERAIIKKLVKESSIDEAGINPSEIKTLIDCTWVKYNPKDKNYQINGEMLRSQLAKIITQEEE